MLSPQQHHFYRLSAALSILTIHVALGSCIGLRPPGMLVDIHRRDGVFFAGMPASSPSANIDINIASTNSTSTTLAGTSGPNGWGAFVQPIDHDDLALGSFAQRFWYGTEHWRGPGSPILLITPGEQSGTGFNDTYLTDQRIIGRFAAAVGAAVVILEHRYWGGSAPYVRLDGPRLRYLTVTNARRDLAAFARGFVPPFDTSGRSSPATAPWILGGGSYAGALAAWEAASDNHPFWAFYATSAVVQSIGDFWQYFDTVRLASPANCSADLVATIAHVDEVLTSGSLSQKLDLKASFLLEDLEDADFANALTFGPLLWQQTQFFSEAVLGYNSYHMFCNYIENVWPNSTNPVPGPEGVGVFRALDGYAKWFTQRVLPGLCQSLGYADFEGLYNTGCFANLNASSPMYSDLLVDNPFSRQWSWLMCNEPLVWFQDASPTGQPSIISRLVSYDYNLAQCALMFPASAGGFGLQHGRSPVDVNAATGGWSVSPQRTPRLLYTNNELDPWRPATVSARTGRPGGPLISTGDGDDKEPVRLIAGGGHCSDIYAANWAANPGARAAAEEQAATLVRWVAEFYHNKGLVQP
ncbi:serine-type peptidase [Grosmannia clavigera kw1407]|uniref:Serine-type peptidase n=1 Tax=Grosmannia clavigera (strain kw1407 / UAMH 11150) TaxID=655863 RepID=F0XJV7_GROCL|nr:serine-type peptidase [Grosmannia clavigera kw1407]EFX02097.1 serine-type peptidase [Grosmannia clavigera kw1407]